MLTYLELVTLAHFAAPEDSEDEDALVGILDRAAESGEDVDGLQERLVGQGAMLESAYCVHCPHCHPDAAPSPARTKGGR